MKIINSNKKYALFRVLLLVLMLNNIPTTKQSNDWCWTKSMANDPTYIFDSKKGGINWGYCEKPSTKVKTVSYDITVDTSKLPKSGTDSTLKIQIFGTQGVTQEKFLGKKFETGSSKELSINDSDVGDINKVIIKLYGRNDYRCKDIKISKGSNNYVFDCLKKLMPCTIATNQFICQEELLPEGDTAYEITIKTSDDEDAATTSPMIIGLVGEKGISPNEMFSETGLEAGSQIQSVIKVNDLGEITGYYLEMTDPGKWKGSYMIVKTIKNGNINQFDLKDVTLINPGLNFKKFDSSPSPDKKSDDSGPEDDSLKLNDKGLIGKSKGGFNKLINLTEDDNDDENDTIKSFAKYETGEDSKDIIDFNASASVSADSKGLNVNKVGGAIDSSEEKNIVNLDCTQKLINPDASNQIFGPDYPTSNVMYSKLLVRCPENCHKVMGFVYGVGIHPETSPICLSALVDNAISVYGGIVQISIFPGFDKYIINKKVTQLNQIKINNFTGHSTKSYVISKVDNIDLVEKDIRILDNKGNSSHTGRLEVRFNGTWGTICRLRNNEESARRVCLDLGYQDGKWLSEDCLMFNGKDHCGTEIYKSMFSDITCSDKDKSLNVCSKKPANKNECPHTQDALISCTNISKNAILTPHGNLRFENVQKSKENHTGRLESYLSTKHLPICSKNFDLASAIVACRQMGYDTGELYNDKAGKFKNAADDNSIPFAATDVKCKGDEASLNECAATTNNIDCTHDLDVVLTCTGKKGDPSGKSQIKALTQNIIVPPALGKLSMLKFKIGCDVKGNDTRFRGDSGSVYLVHCPSNCAKEKGSLYGLGLYTGDSSVCQAAIHSGVIADDKGGLLAYTKTWGNGYYIGIAKNGLSSSEINSAYPMSFTVQGKSSGWVNMWKIWRENYGGVYLENENKIKEVSDKESKINLRSKYANTKKTTLTAPSNSEKQTKISFIETNMQMYTQGIPTPIFEWIEENPSHIFNERDNKVRLSDKKIKPMKKYQILMRLKMTEFKGKKAFIFSNGGCFHFNIFVDDADNLTFGDPCSASEQINTNIQMAVNDRSIIHAFYDESVLKVTIFSEKLNKPIVKTFKKTLEINDSNLIAIGKRPDSNDSFYYGFLDFIQIYDSELPLSSINSAIDTIMNKSKVPQGLQSRNTLDKRDCITACSKDAVPGKPGSTSPPKDADPYASADTLNVPLKPATAEELQKKTSAFNYSEAYIAKYGTYDPSEVGNTESIEINCITTLKDKRFDGSFGKIFRVKCPSCKGVKRPVYGSFIYHPLSSICKSAVHAGNLKKEEGGYVLIELVSGKKIYNGSVGADKGLSSTFSSAKISFRTKAAKPPTKITCEDSPSNPPFNTASIGTKFLVVCPKKCSEKDLKIFGSEIYTDKTSICLAGIHHGVMNDRGGEIEFLIEAGQSYYKGTRSFGVISKSRDAYVRSFKFLGVKSAVFYKYKEDYNNVINNKWDIQTYSKVLDAKDNIWEFLEFSYMDKVAREYKKTKTIHHKGKMRAVSKNDLGTHLILKNVEWNNGRVKSNFYFKDSNLFAFLFRFADQNNYYSIEFDLASLRDNIRLVSRVNGISKTVKQETMVLSLATWYRVTIIMMNDDIKVFIQTDNIRENKAIFEAKMPDISRGTIGYASNGNYESYINGIEVDDYSPQASNKMDTKNKRSWVNYLKHVEPKSVKKFCTGLFGNDQLENQRCRLPPNYCKMKCDDYIPSIENILNFNCYTDCLGKIKGNDNEVKTTKESWKPKIGDRIDFLPKGLKKYSASVIISGQVKKTNKKIEIFTISYLTPEGEQKTAIAEFPNISIKKCGSELPKRKDC